jgi:uncharacterized protein (TIGR02001 family)
MRISSGELSRTIAAPVLALLGLRDVTAAQLLGGSLDITSDYVVRGVSRSHGDPTVQADLHVISDSGLLAGLSASGAQPDPVGRQGAELGVFAGYARQVGDNWRIRLVASYYGYPDSTAGSGYNYREVGVDVAWSDWLSLAAEYSPDTPQYVYYQGLRRYTQRSAEAVVHSGWHHRLAASAGGGYSQSGGPAGSGYPYWSVGAMLDLAPVSVSLKHLSAGSGVESLSYGVAVHNEWVATLIWRF